MMQIKTENDHILKVLTQDITDIKQLLSSNQLNIDSQLKIDHDHIKEEYRELEQKFQEIEEKFQAQQELINKKEEKFDAAEKILFFSIRIFSIISVILIVLGDIFMNKPGSLIIMDFGSVILGLTFIVIISLSMRGEISPTIQSKISKKIPNVAIFLITLLFFALNLLVWHIAIKNKYFYQIAIFIMLSIPFGTLRGYYLTKQYKRHLSIPCISAFFGFVSGFIFYFTYFDTTFLEYLIDTGRAVVNKIV